MFLASCTKKKNLLLVDGAYVHSSFSRPQEVRQSGRWTLPLAAPRWRTISKPAWQGEDKEKSATIGVMVNALMPIDGSMSSITKVLDVRESVTYFKS
jgi:hypothetical protein